MTAATPLETELDLSKRFEELLRARATDFRDFRNALFEAGIFRSASAEKLIAVLDQVKDSLVEAAQKVHDTDYARLASAVADLREDLQRSEELSDKLSEERARIESELRRSDQKLHDAGVALSDAIAHLRAARVSYPSRWLAFRVRELTTLEADLAEYRLELEQRFFRYEQGMLEIAKRRREENSEEFDRRAKVYDERYMEVDRRFKDLDDYVASLRKIGVTRQISGYMVWAGYLGFAAFGWFLGIGLDQAIGSSLLEGSNFVQALSEGMRTFSEKYGPLLAFGAALGAPFVLLGLVAIAFIVVERVSARDRSWHRGGGKTRAEPFVDAGVFLPVLPWKRPVTKTELKGALRSLPIVYLWLALPLVGTALLGQFPTNLGGEAAARAWNSLLLTYFGIVCAIAIAGLCVIYIARIAEPRSQLVLRSEVGPSRILSAHIEIVTLLLCLPIAVIVAVVYAGFRLGVSPIWQPAWTIAALYFMAVNGIVIAYGVVYRGLFKDYDALKEERQDLWRTVEKHRAWPAIPTDEEDLYGYEAMMRELDARIAQLWRTVDKDWQDGGALRSTLRAEEATRADFLLEPLLTAEWNDADHAARSARREAELQRANLVDITLRIERMGISALRQRVTAANTEIEALKFKHAREVAGLHQSYQLLKLECETALNIGRRLSGALGT